MSRVDISIIIPYYNSGLYIQEAIDSVHSYNGKYEYEIIIINDGTTDELSLDKLYELENSGKYTVFHQENKGPGAARNFGVKHAKGEFLLFLDSDNKIKPEYIEEGVYGLKTDSQVGVIYADAIFFDNNKQLVTPRFYPKPFEILKLLDNNFIDMCSIVRKISFDEAGGFEENRLIIGHEDWELWLRLYKHNVKFKYINKVLFGYRVLDSSLAASFKDEHKLEQSITYIFTKHLDLLYASYKDIYMKNNILIAINQKEKSRPLRTFIKHILKR